MYRKSNFGGGRPSGRKPSFQGGRSFGRPARGFTGQRIDVSKFINKAVITEVADVFVPEHAFTDFVIDERLKQNIVTKGYVTPTPLHARTSPHIRPGGAGVGIANTGTGKTAAFLIPLIHKVLANPKENVLIVVPTRELAIQIEQELRGFTTGLKLFSACLVGGAPIGKQISQLRYRNQFVIGTPGRLKDLIERKRLNLASYGTVVLDEADRMLDMGFINDVRYMMSLMSAERHTLFFSATLSKEIEKLISEFLNKPVTISVKTRDTSKSVDQDVIKTRGADKMTMLKDLLKQADFNKVLIFGRTKHGVEKLSQALNGHGFKVESIHGDENHSKRQQALKLFKDDHIQVLVATDVAARGLDINGVSHVINYDLPATYDDYVHRIGRTGRGGKSGKALTFID